MIRNLITVLDKDGKFTYVSPSTEQVFGFDPDEKIGQPAINFVHPDDRENAKQFFNQLLDNPRERTERITVRSKTDNESYVWIETIGRNELESAVGGIVLNSRDITERKERETELQRERNRFTALFRNSGDAIAFANFDEDEPIVHDVNPAFEETFGINRVAAIGRSIDDIVVPDDETIAQQAIEINRRIRNGERVEMEVRRKTPEGLRDFLVHSTPLNPGEEANRSYAIYSDITDQKTYERALEGLHESINRLLKAQTTEEAYSDIVSIATSVLDSPFTGVYRWNDEAEQLEPERFSKHVFEPFHDPPVFHPGEGLVGMVFESGKPQVIDDATNHPLASDFESSELRGYGAFPMGEHGVIVLGSPNEAAFDQQDAALASTLAAHASVALHRIAREEELIDRERTLERQNARLDEFASVVSHDLRNPLTVAKGRVELTAKDTDSEHLDGVRQALHRMELLIDSMLSLARAGDTVGETGAVELSEVVDRAWKYVETRSARLESNTEATVRADPIRLQQLLENVFANAIEHGGPETTVTIGDLANGFFIEDDGPGIPEDIRENVFEPGYSTTSDGTGFGLSIVRDISDAHGWSMDVKTGTEGGARLEFTEAKVKAKTTQ